MRDGQWPAVLNLADKDRHQLFLEPEGHDTNEVYLNGFSTSLPAELQQDLVRMIPGMEEARVIRPGYAIEYDFVDPRIFPEYSGDSAMLWRMES